MKILVTGGAGFIGSNLVRHLLSSTDAEIVVLDSLTYAGNMESLVGPIDDPRCTFVKASITDRPSVRSVFDTHGIDYVMHLAAESHVDRSIMSAEPFIVTNVLGTLILLEESRRANVKRFLHVSTDEVYGALTDDEEAFTEEHQINPSSPYSASKAASDHVVQSFVTTHKMDCVITRCSNNYGPFQFPEKFIPLMTLNAIDGLRLPIYGDGLQVRDWLHVEDHCAALLLALLKGTQGAVYNVGGFGERKNIDVVSGILSAVGASSDQIEHVADRPGHDRRYAINHSKITSELGWKPQWTFDEGLAATIEWYQSNPTWCDHVRSGEYTKYYDEQYNRS